MYGQNNVTRKYKSFYLLMKQLAGQANDVSYVTKFDKNDQAWEI